MADRYLSRVSSPSGVRMRKNDVGYLGDGFSPIRFWVFNFGMAIVWLSLCMLQTFAVIGVGYMFTVDPVNTTTTITGQMGCAFINLLYGTSALVLVVFIQLIWIGGNVYIIRKELYELANWLFRWDDL